MPAAKLRAFLDEREVDYITIAHSRAYTAHDTALEAHVPDAAFAKTVIVKVDGEMAMAVLPASHHLHSAELRRQLDARHVELAAEEELAGRFPGCEIGAMPPFGNLYQMPVYVAEALSHARYVAFNAGTHAEVVQLLYADFARLVEPRVLEFSSELPAAERHEDRG